MGGAGEAASAVEEPERLLCPITHIMYRDPCFVPESGNTYERSAVEQYWASVHPPRDPLTNMSVTTRAIYTNWGVRREVQKFLEDHPEHVPSGWDDRRLPSPADSAPAARVVFWRPVVACVVLVLTLLVVSQVVTLPPAAPTVDIQDALTPPKGSSIRASVQDGRFVAHLPAPGFGMESADQLFFATVWFGFIGVWTVQAVRGSPLFAMFSLPFWAAATESLASSSFRRNTLLEAVFEVSRHTGYRRNCSVIWLGWAASGSVEILGNASTSVTIHTTTEASLLEVLSGSELALLS